MRAANAVAAAPVDTTPAELAELTDAALDTLAGPLPAHNPQWDVATQVCDSGYWRDLNASDLSTTDCSDSDSEPPAPPPMNFHPFFQPAPPPPTPPPANIPPNIFKVDVEMALHYHCCSSALGRRLALAAHRALAVGTVGTVGTVGPLSDHCRK